MTLRTLPHPTAVLLERVCVPLPWRFSLFFSWKDLWPPCMMSPVLHISFDRLTVSARPRRFDCSGAAARPDKQRYACQYERGEQSCESGALSLAFMSVSKALAPSLSYPLFQSLSSSRVTAAANATRCNAHRRHPFLAADELCWWFV